MNNPYTPLLPDNFYHVYNRAIGNEKLFLSNENYYYFLRKMRQHILPVADIFAYSLIPNHFHILIRVKPTECVLAFFKVKKRRAFVEKKDSITDFIMEQFSNWLNGYTKAFNKMYDRKGGLFIDYTKRTEALSESDITSFIFYIHKNAVHHGLKKAIGKWLFDSYNTILSDRVTILMRDEMINWFGSRQLFEEFHRQPIDLKVCKGFIDKKIFKPL